MTSNSLILRDYNQLPLAVGSEEAYIGLVNQIALLTPEEELDLAHRLAYENDLEAARRLVLSHLRFVVHIARSYMGYGLPLADLIQEGNVGLMKAVKRFDPAHGVRLVSFAVHWIRAEIHEFVIRNWRIVKIATTKAQRKLFFNLRSAKKRFGWLNNDEVNAIADDLGVKPETVREMEARLSSNDVCFDAPTDSSDDDAVYAPAHYLEDRRFDPLEAVESAEAGENEQNQLATAMEQLDTRSQEIIRRRWLNEDKATLHELAAEYNVSAERIRQLENNAMKKMKAVFSA